MSHLPYHQQQLEFMKALASHRIEWLDPFFRYLQFFDSPYFFFLLIPIIWLGYSYQWGLRLFYWFTANNLVNYFAKQAFGWPRPNTDLPELGLLQPSGPGFPSGGAQSCLFVGVILIYYWRTRAAWVIGLIYILLISFSRLYLGVHYPIDVMGGWVIAATLLTFFIYTKDPLEKWLAKKGHFFCLILSLLIPAAILWFMPRKTVYYIVGSMMGVGIGTYFSLKYHLFLRDSKKISEGIGRSIIGVALLFVIVLLWPADKSFAKSFTAGLFMSLAASPVCKWFMDKKFNR